MIYGLGGHDLLVTALTTEDLVTARHVIQIQISLLSNQAPHNMVYKKSMQHQKELAKDRLTN